MSMSPTLNTASTNTASITLVIAALLLFSGCSSNVRRSDVVPLDQPGPYENLDKEAPTVVALETYQDPLEKINRPIFVFNDKVYRYFLGPLAKGYRKITPKPVNKSIGNFFLNLREPIFCINNLLQARAGDSGKSLLRLGVNSTVGLLGLFDPAAAWFDMPREEATFGDTLAFYGVGYGAYLVLPFAGPGDFRSGSSLILDYFAHPLNYLDDKDTVLALKLFDYFQDNSATLASYADTLDQISDPYIFTRNLYLQNLVRDAEARQNEDTTPNGGEVQ
jgi:phospholipid-binding lipoprotein MlaA